MITDTSYWNFYQIIYINFTSSVIYPFMEAASKPAAKNSKRRPNGNLFGPINQLRIWLSVLAITGGLVGGYYYYTSTDEFVPNSRPVAN